MRTTIEVDKKLLDSVLRLSEEKSITKAVTVALSDYVQRKRAEKLFASLGTRDLDLDDWYEFRHQERT